MIKNKTQGAELTGTASCVAGDTDLDSSIGSSTNNVLVNDSFNAISTNDVIDTLSVSVASADSVVVISMCSQQNNGGGSVKVRNTTTATDIGTLTMTSAGPGEILLTSILVVDSSPNAGSNTYQVIATANGVLFEQHIKIQVVNLNDTHTAIAKKTNEVIQG